MKKLVIVESPTKAKTISKFLGKGFTVESSFGHVRDLPKSKMGVDTEGGTFEPHYVIPADKKDKIKKLKDLAKKSDGVIFATDEDREGEAISWHLAQILDVEPEKAERIVFHEITKHAIDEALKTPRHIDQKLVDAQQARRVLDRLVGYELSPLLWKKVARGLSAGRVQSVAVRLTVEREREIQGFVAQEYWTVAGTFSSPDSQEEKIQALLHSKNGKKLDKFDINSKEKAGEVLAHLGQASYIITSLEKKETKRTPPPPFTTSTLQQQASHKLGFSAKQTMRLAQQLYEGIDIGTEGSAGLITYMRTDSVNLSDKFIEEAHGFIRTQYGDGYVSDAPRRYHTKSKLAQEAHEAIRPTDPSRRPESIRQYLDPRQYKLYDLVWRRAVATQMTEARLNKATLDIESDKKEGTTYTFRATGQTMIFDGWMKLYPGITKEEMLPELREGEKMICHDLKPEQHFTEPPARYSDATLVKALEEHSIGRPSTYAPTIATIEERHYVERDEQKRLKPTDVAFVVNDLLVHHFPNIVDYQFTAQMEESLDQIAHGEQAWQPLISLFYKPFHETIVEKSTELSKKEITEEATDEICPNCASAMVIKIGRYGKFIACSNYPTCKTTKPTPEEAGQEPQTTDEVCELCGKPMAIKHGRYGTFLGCSGYPECKFIKKREKNTGVACPLCGKGEFAERRSKRGKTFYSCNQYPECKNILWSKPTGETCETCKALMVLGPKDSVRCSNKECPSLQKKEQISEK
ncbi:MAG: DNA topoisomerase I [Candidatus Magasanikbacteria bacterium RIFCSPHIGHO2_02_FULL_47_14]|uniref:DNA topoisomerase 1 n=1 Tax=Candidatus Magasanikbacteria bacterium RIFCSPHIGHO2_02_FULL_47_14 TaxID=1798680 RepID=A0A1F6M3Y8_9BACT|nr:MAG: DNA topoisomerase I [Candidatus Magasanikbacteria bacterium RIFCSPHIGHO2_02_FULL_47_14]